MEDAYYVVFFDEEYTIKEAHKTRNYPTVKEITYLLKCLEQLDIKEVEKLRMGILTAQEFRAL